MICVEGYKAFRGVMRITPTGDGAEPFDLPGEWLYKPEYKCWYGRCKQPQFLMTSSFPAEICEVLEDDTERIEITNKPRLTQDELTLCRIIGAKWISRDKNVDDSHIYAWNEQPCASFGIFGVPSGDEALAWLCDSALPSIRPGDCIHVEPLLAEAHDIRA